MSAEKETQRVVIGSYYWKGLCGVFARGAVVDGPEQVLGVVQKLFRKHRDRFLLELLNDLLPYSLLFDEVYVPIQQDPGLSAAFLNDLRSALGVTFANQEELEETEEDPHERGSHLLRAIYRRENADQLIHALYEIAGVFAADHPDFIPVLSSMDSAVHLSRRLAARLVCRPNELSVLQSVAEAATDPSANRHLRVLESVLRAHRMPLLSVDAFSSEEGVVDVDYMLFAIESLRRHWSLKRFRAKMAELTDIPSDHVEETVEQELVEDLRDALEEAALSPSKIRQRLVTAILLDLVGILIPLPTDTALEGMKIASELVNPVADWHLFVFAYGETIKARGAVENLHHLSC